MTDKAQEAINEIFKRTQIKRVVCIDDKYVETTSVEDVIGLYVSLEPQKQQSIRGLENISLYENQNIQRNELRKLWDTFDNERKDDIYKQILSNIDSDNNSDKAKDIRSADILAKLLEDQELLELSPNKWNTQKVSLLKEAEANPTLFLFDQDLSKDIGGTPLGGIKFIREIYDSERGFGVVCGLLSHTFSADQEFDKRQELLREFAIDPDDLILISKQNLLDNKLIFANKVKRTILSKYCKKLKDKVSDVLSSAQDSALKRVAEIDIYDFEQIVFRASYHEGIWEPDTLFRLFGLFHRDIARKKAKGDTDLHNLTTRIRSVSSIPMESMGDYIQNKQGIQRLELYEDKEYLSNYHIPIDLGDMFMQSSGKKKLFILLTQPCDLMVRSEDGKRDSTEAFLAEIVSLKEEPRYPEGFYELPYFRSDGKRYFVSFKMRHTVKLSILDLCVYQDDGQAKLILDAQCPSDIIPAWQLHYEQLREQVKKQIDLYVSLKNSDYSNEVLELATPRSSYKENDLFKGKIDTAKQSISFNCERTLRLCQPRSAAMLTKFANYIARAAFEMDFGKEEKKITSEIEIAANEKSE